MKTGICVRCLRRLFPSSFQANYLRCWVMQIPLASYADVVGILCQQLRKSAGGDARVLHGLKHVRQRFQNAVQARGKTGSGLLQPKEKAHIECRGCKNN